MEKRGKGIFLKISLILLLFLFINVAVYLVQFKIFNKGLTGFSIQSSVVEIYSSMSLFSKIFFIGQWIILLIILLFMVFKDRKNKKSDEPVYINIKENFDKKKTDLDILYDVLKVKKELKISTISKSFNISKEVAQEWCEILESANLASIDYPGFGEPVVRIIEKASNESKNKQESKEEIKEKPKEEPKKEIQLKKIKIKKTKINQPKINALKSNKKR